MNLMRELHPQWEFLFFSDGDAREFVKREFPDHLELYDWYPRPVLKADFFRLLVVERLGGFYLDTDFLLLKKLDQRWLAAGRVSRRDLDSSMVADHRCKDRY